MFVQDTQKLYTRQKKFYITKHKLTKSHYNINNLVSDVQENHKFSKIYSFVYLKI